MLCCFTRYVFILNYTYKALFYNKTYRATYDYSLFTLQALNSYKSCRSLYHMFTMTSTSQMSNWDKVRAFECFLHIATDDAVVKLLSSGKSSAQMRLVFIV